MGTRQQNPVPSNISDSSPPPDLATESYNVILEQLDRAIGEIVEKIRKRVRIRNPEHEKVQIKDYRVRTGDRD